MSCSQPIEIKRFENTKIEFDLRCEREQIDLENELITAAGDLSFKGSLSTFGNYSVIEGRVELETEIACGRCLAPITFPLDFEFRNAYVERSDYDRDLEIELEIKGLEISIFEGNEIDLGEVAIEQALVNLPIQMICDENCRGFCSVCGKNQNLNTCSCDDIAIDSRWSALEDFKK